MSISERAESPGSRLRAAMDVERPVQIVGAIIAVIFALAAQSFVSAREGATTYRIQPGETLGGIASATGVSLERLVSLNGLKNPDLIVAGQELTLTEARVEPASYPCKVPVPGCVWQIVGQRPDPLQYWNQMGLRIRERVYIGPGWRRHGTVQHGRIVEDGTPSVIPNRGGYKTTPSMVAIAENGKRLVGHIAKRQAITNA